MDRRTSLSWIINGLASLCSWIPELAAWMVGQGCKVRYVPEPREIPLVRYTQLVITELIDGGRRHFPINELAGLCFQARLTVDAKYLPLPVIHLRVPSAALFAKEHELLLRDDVLAICRLEDPDGQVLLPDIMLATAGELEPPVFRAEPYDLNRVRNLVFAVTPSPQARKLCGLSG